MKKNVLLLFTTIFILLASFEFSLFILEKITKARVDKASFYSNNAEVRIISIGESTTYGLGVEKDDTYTYQLDKLLGKKIKIYNLGIFSITSTTVLRNFEKNIIKTKSSIAILNIGNNDFSYSLSQQNTILDPNIPLSITKILYAFRIYKFYKLLRDRKNNKNFMTFDTDDIGNKYMISMFDLSIDEKADFNTFFHYADTQLTFNINEIIKLAERYDVKLIFVGYFTSPANKYLKKFFSNSTIPYIEIDNAENYKQYLTKDNFHPNPKGHEYIASEIFNIVQPLIID